MEFGFLKNTRRVVVDNIEIKPISDINDKIARLYNFAVVSDGWIYPPLEQVHQSADEQKNFKIKPKLSSNFFTIEPTHSITIHPHDDEKLRPVRA
jgi:hypothetical protein